MVMASLHLHLDVIVALGIGMAIGYLMGRFRRRR